MKVALSTVGKFHTFDLARELHARGLLAMVASGYPRFKLKNEGIPQDLIRTFPWVQGSYMAFPWKQHLSDGMLKGWENLSAASFNAWMPRVLPECDLYVGLSGSTLAAGRAMHRRGGRYICDRGSSHIREHEHLLREEHELWQLPYSGIDLRAIEREESEYAEADCITVPSTFVLDSFVRRGVARDKLRLLPYGVNLSRFNPVGEPDADRFDVLFVGGMSLRKGVQYLVQAYQRLQHPAKSLTFVGTPLQALIDQLGARGLWPADARVVGHMPQLELKTLMSRSHVMVLPSLEEGLAMVQAQAMACGCPVISSTNTGAEDLFTNGEHGFIVPIRNVDSLVERLQTLADDPARRAAMGARSLARVQGMGGWHEYGDRAVTIYRELLQS
jgi:glycosyltransferase involved in cell wall biosynthesis